MAGREEIVVNGQEALKAVRNVIEYVSNIATAASVYKAALDAAHDKSELGFLKKLADNVANLSSSVKSISAILDDIQEGVEKYAAETEEYSDDATGLA